MIYEGRRVKRNDEGLDFTSPKHYVTPQMEMETAAMGNREEPATVGVSDSGHKVAIAPVGGGEPQFILFIKNACPCSIDAQPLFNRLAMRFAGHIEFVGVIDSDLAGAKRYASQFSVAFPVVADPGLGTIHSFGATAGVYSALVARNGHLIKMWPGYSASMLGEMNRTLSKAAGVKAVPFDPQYAPRAKTTGCAFGTSSFLK
jgi:hypothetical protein